MDRTSCSAASMQTLHRALELSKSSWLLAIQFPDREQPLRATAPFFVLNFMPAAPNISRTSRDIRGLFGSRSR
jgi:hypothetical protein